MEGIKYLLNSINNIITKINHIIDNIYYSTYFYTYNMEFKEEGVLKHISYADGCIINIPKNRIDIAMKIARNSLIEKWESKGYTDINIVFKKFEK